MVHCHIHLVGVLLSLALQSLASIPADIEVDLIFPKANQTYKSVWPFPVIFAIRNASSLWYEYDDDVDHFSFWLSYDFQDRNRSRSYARGLWNTNADDTPRLNKSDDPFLWFGAITRPMTNTEYLLRYAMRLSQNCSADGDPYVKSDAPDAYSPADGIYFKVDNETGTLPDLTGCPASVFNFSIVSTGKDIHGACHVVADPGPEPDPCGFQVDDLAARVETAMLSYAGCPNGTWPDFVGLTEDGACNAPESSASRMEAVYTMSMVLVSVAVLVLFF